MRKILLGLMTIVTLINCSKSEDNANTDLIGKWKLVEVLADPGDGSGTFQSVASDKVIEFKSDGTIVSNGSICNMSIESNSTSSGTYSLSDSTINSPDCQNSSFKIRFHKENSKLIISYPCDEACLSKYVRTN